MIRSLVLVSLLLPMAVPTSLLFAAEGDTAWKDGYNSGQKAIDDGEYDKALEILAKSEETATTARGKAPAANGQGLALLRSFRYADAVPHFERALKHDPNYLISKKNLGTALVKLYRLGLAEKEVLTQAVEVLSTVPEGEASSLAEAKGLLEAAEKQAQAPAAPAEPAGKTWRELADEGDAAEGLGQFDHALKCYAQAQAISKTPASKGAACNRQGLCLMKTRKFEDAVSHFSDACKADATNKTFLNNLGYCQVQLYEKTAGAEHLTSALEALRKVKEIDATYKPETLALAEEYAAKAGLGKAEEKAAEEAAPEPTAVPPSTSKK